MFTQLQVASSYSLLKSTITLDELITYAKQNQLEAVSLIEKDELHSSIKFYEACLKAQIKPLIGLSLPIEIHNESNRFSLIAKNYKGYLHLLMLASKLALDGSLNYEALLEVSADVIIILEMQSSYFHHQVNQQSSEALSYYESYFKALPHFYIGLQRTTDMMRMNTMHLQQFAQHVHAKVVALNDVCYLYQTQAVILQHLRLIDEGKSVTDRETSDVERYYKSKEDMINLFSDCPEAISNISEIISLCQLEIPLQQQLLPKFVTPNDVSSFEYLKALSYRGLKKRYETDLTQHHLKRLDYELSVVERMGFEDYFLIVWDFIKFAKQQKIVVGCGRGSAAGSLIAYVLGITNVDPVRYELLFERFLNPERLSMPDIDIDFQDTRRDEVISYVHQKYGTDNVLQILTFGTFQSKSAWRDTARVYGVEMKLVNTVAKNIVSGQSLITCAKESAPLQQLFTEYPKLKQIYEVASHIERLPRHISVHAAGIIISDQNLMQYTPVMKGPSDVHLSQFEASDLEMIGLLKMDFLGLKNLTMLNEIEKLVQSEVPTFQVEYISVDDEKTFELIAKAKTTGVFQLESEGMKQALRLIRPTHLEDVIAVNALFRPGPMKNIPLFAKRKHGEEPITYYHEALKPILYKTYGIIVYQEQIMQIANIVCGYSLGEADVLRRAVSKKKRSVLESERDKFVFKAVENGYTKHVANELYELILKFADYGFNRSHAVAYSMIAYQMAYLKTHYPLYFMSVALSHSIGNDFSTAQYVKEARQLGLEVLGPSVLSSEGSYTIENKRIRFGLLPIKNIGIHLVNQLVAERNKKPFESFYDFVSRCQRFLNVKTFRYLIDVGACDAFELNRTTLYKNLEEIIEFSKYNNGLFFNEFRISHYQEVQTKKEIMQLEHDLLGFYLNSHPLRHLQKRATEEGWLMPVDIQNTNFTKVACIGYVEKIKEIRDKKGQLMCFMEISDEYVTISVVVFAKQYSQELKRLNGECIVVFGRINQKNFEKNITCDKIISVS